MADNSRVDERSQELEKRKIELRGFAGGLILKISPEDINKNQLQDAENVTCTEIGGVIKTRRGLEEWDSTVFSGDINIYYQELFDTKGLIIRADENLYDNLTPIKYNLDDANMEIEEFAAWLIMVNGYENLKYKQSGMNLSWHGLYTYGWEEDHLDDSWLAMVMGFKFATGDYWCSFVHEVGTIEE